LGEFSNKIAKVVEFIPRKKRQNFVRKKLPGYQKLPSSFWFQPRLKRSTVSITGTEIIHVLKGGTENHSRTHRKNRKSFIHHTESEIIHHRNLR
jgi:hypothetical protein